MRGFDVYITHEGDIALRTFHLKIDINETENFYELGVELITLNEKKIGTEKVRDGEAKEY